MKNPLVVLFIVLVCIAAFLIGRENSGGHASRGVPATNTRTTSSQSLATSAAGARPKVRTRIGPDVFTVEKAALLTPEKRIALLKNAALLKDTGRQSDVLCGLISAMTQPELMEATKVLLDVQNRGNSWSQAVWDTLWTQWGRVNAEACLALSKEEAGNTTWSGFKGLNTPNDYRCMMAGWLETNPEAAMAWARQAKDNLRDATGAALAITSGANGDLKRMEAAILSIAGDKLTARACFQDYFDLAASSGEKPPASTTYDRLNPELRAAAWPVVMERLAYTDPQMAATWLEKHAGDPGRDYGRTYRLIDNLARNDPAGTTAWAATLPVSQNGGSGEAQPHPATVALARWRQRDPAAAGAWLQNQPPDSPWAR